MKKCFITDLEVANYIEEKQIEYDLVINGHTFHLKFELNTDIRKRLNEFQKHICTCMLWNNDWPIDNYFKITYELIDRCVTHMEYPKDFDARVTYFIKEFYLNGGAEHREISASTDDFYRSFAKDKDEHGRIIDTAIQNNWIEKKSRDIGPEMLVMSAEGKSYCQSLPQIQQKKDDSRDRPLEGIKVFSLYVYEDFGIGGIVQNLVQKWGATYASYGQGINKEWHNYNNALSAMEGSNIVLLIKTANSDKYGVWRDIINRLSFIEDQNSQILYYVVMGDDSPVDDNSHIYDKRLGRLIDIRLIPNRNKILLPKIQEVVNPPIDDVENAPEEDYSSLKIISSKTEKEIEQNQFNGDLAINKKEHDKFQRYPFANRISKTILGRTGTDNLTIAIYGSWGEGKTSVLNFIKGDLDEYLKAFVDKEKHEKPFVYIDFNPWRFDQEDALLISFFNQLAVALDGPPGKSIFGRRLALDSKRDSFGKFIKKYADHIPSVQGIPVGSVAKGIGAFLGNAEVDNYKEKINEKLIKSNKKIVIFIDDIDRLDKKEILSLFRLIKLTANFSNLIYIMAFDDAVIGKVLGESYGEIENPETGNAFLEKIVQVPLRLPRAPEKHLENYFLELLKTAFDSNGINFNEGNIREFHRLLFRTASFRLETPRSAIRYSNAISFSLPLVINEVNLSDFLTIEALRVFYPDVHAFVRQNSNWFIGGEYMGTGREAGDDVRKKEFEELFGPVYNTYDETQKKILRYILTFLFQGLKHTWYGEYTVHHSRSHNLQNNRRISSKHYFDKYFTYCVLNDDIPDVAISNLLEKITKENSTDSSQIVSDFIDAYHPDVFLRKLRAKENEFTADQAIAIVKTLSFLGSKFDIQEFITFRFTATIIQAAEFIGGLIKNKVLESDRYLLLEWVVERAEPFWFSFEIYIECHGRKKGDQSRERILSDEQFAILFQKFISRLVNIHPETPLFVSDPSGTLEVFNHWKNVNKLQLNAYVKQYIEKDVSLVLPLVKMFASHQKTLGDGGSERPYLTDFEKRNYDYLALVLEADYVYKKVLEFLKKRTDYKAKFTALNRDQTDANILEQFLFHHQNNPNGSDH